MRAGRRRRLNALALEAMAERIVQMNAAELQELVQRLRARLALEA